VPAHCPDSIRTMSRPASFRSWLNFVVPRDVPELREEDRRHRGPHAQEAPEERVGREGIRQPHRLPRQPGDPRLHRREAGHDRGGKRKG
jgi:hypothetical protein